VLRDLEPLAELGDELGVVLRDGALRPEGPAAVSMWLFDDASEPLPGGFEQSELSPKAPAMSLKSFPQDLVFVARSSVLIKGLAARLGVKWSLASKWAPMAVEALDLNEKDARGVRRRGRLSKLGDVGCDKTSGHPRAPARTSAGRRRCHDCLKNLCT
jgi:hypothetical protein